MLAGDSKRLVPQVFHYLLGLSRRTNSGMCLRLMEKKGLDGRTVLGMSIRESGGYSWTGQRKSAEAFLVTVTVPALWAARTAAWDVRSTGAASWLNVTVKTFQWPP